VLGPAQSRDYWISCLINPSAGREFEWGGDRFTPAANPRKVLVVGAGPAGLEAARAAAERGHRVEIVEALPVIGGQFRLAGQQPRRAQILDLMDWYERQFERLGVTLRLNTYLDEDEIAAHPADVVILATGSLPDDDGFQRWLPQEAPPAGAGERPCLVSPEAVLRREARRGDAVVVMTKGRNWRGVGTAWCAGRAGPKGDHRHARSLCRQGNRPHRRRWRRPPGAGGKGRALRHRKPDRPLARQRRHRPQPADRRGRP
jgi:hypothetical protein